MKSDPSSCPTCPPFTLDVELYKELILKKSKPIKLSRSRDPLFENRIWPKAAMDIEEVGSQDDSQTHVKTKPGGVGGGTMVSFI